jgi:cytoplasmic FMR1 interacting protein
LVWAGVTFITILGQQYRFEAFDHSYHLFRVNQVDGQSEKVNNIVIVLSFITLKFKNFPNLILKSFLLVKSLQTFMNRIRKHQVLNQEIFAIINKYLKSSDPESQSVQNVRCFQPPLDSSIVA